MTTKTKILLIAIALLAAYGFGRWSAPEKVKIVKQVVEVEKKASSTDKDGSKDTETHIVEHPDGTKETIITTHENWEKHHQSADNSSTTSTDSKEVTARRSQVTLSALAGVNLMNSATPIYGLSLTKPILGPITIGGWYLSNQTLGLSLGLTF